MSEAEKRLHRCCFTGHRPEKISAQPEEVQAWLEDQIRSAISRGFTTFITGCAMGVDIWAGQITLKLKCEYPGLHLIAATPWHGFAKRWNEEWRRQYDDLLKQSDLVKAVSDCYHNEVFSRRNLWMVDHSSLVIAYYNGEPGGTKETIEYAEKCGIEVISHIDQKPGKR